MVSSRSFPEVEEAKRMLAEAQDWWPWSWASEGNKIRLRSTIETATAVLWREVERAKHSWSPPMKKAYQELIAKGRLAKNVDQEAGQAAKTIFEAETELDKTTTQAQKIFAAAEQELDPAKARQGVSLSREAIEKHEEILKAALAARQV